MVPALVPDVGLHSACGDRAVASPTIRIRKAFARGDYKGSGTPCEGRMSIRNFHRFVRSEATAGAILHRYRFAGGLGRGPLPLARCPRCSTPGAYALAIGRWRCGACRYTFGLLTETWLEACRLSPMTWLWPITSALHHV